jgi:putative FmdB family regulatory protein
MPIYEYSCNTCSEIFAFLKWANATDEDTACPKCGSKDIRKLLSSFSCSPGSDPGPSSGGSFSGFSGGG